MFLIAMVEGVCRLPGAPSSVWFKQYQLARAEAVTGYPSFSVLLGMVIYGESSYIPASRAGVSEHVQGFRGTRHVVRRAFWNAKR